VATLLRSLKVAAHETDQAVELVGDLREAHIDMGHALFVQGHTFGLQFLDLSLAALDFRHHHGGVLQSPDLLFEVHLNLG
jgi:hypothetical protein